MKKILIVFAFLAFCASVTAQAQDAVPPPVDPAAVAATDPAAVPVPVDPAVEAAAVAAAEAARKLVLSQPFHQSLLFTPLEIVAIEKAKDGKTVGDGMLQSDKAVYIPPVRIISLAGVLLRKPGDWIIWINGRKVTPDQLLPEMVDVTVSKDNVHLKWYDIGMNKIISLSLRPHQTYDIVTGLLLPG